MKTFHEIVFDRRTCKEFDGRAISQEQIQQLLTWAVRAPNHRLNEPWFFRILNQKAVSDWLSHIEAKLNETELSSLKRSIDRVRHVGALIFVSSKISENKTLTRENYAAVCAAIENLLLGASALGIQSFWSTSRLMCHPETMRFLEWQENEDFVGAIWLGYGKTPELSARKPIQKVSRWWS